MIRLTKNITNFLTSELYPKRPQTFFHKIYEINPGTINEFKKDKLKTTKYYSLKKNLNKYKNKNISLDKFEEVLENSIKIRLRSDVPLSLHFSGGMNSTALLCKLIEIYGKKIPIKLLLLNTKIKPIQIYLEQEKYVSI